MGATPECSARIAPVTLAVWRSLPDEGRRDDGNGVDGPKTRTGLSRRSGGRQQDDDRGTHYDSGRGRAQQGFLGADAHVKRS